MGIPSTLQASLRDRGQRLTSQRKRVLALFEEIGEGCHLSAEEVHQHLLQGEKRISLATVYRSLRLLASVELLQELELPEGGRRFELMCDAHRNHHHLVCIRCGSTKEFKDDAILAAAQAAAAYQGFQLMKNMVN